MSRVTLMDGQEVEEAVRAAVAEAVTAITEAYAEEVRELRRGLFALKGLLTAAEAGEVLGGVTAETVMEYVKEKGLPCYRPGRRPLFTLDDLQAWAKRFPDGAPDGTARR